MTTTDYALIVSICSAAISLTGVAWNVWSKFIFPNAALHVRLHMSQVIDLASTEPGRKLVRLDAVNHGQASVSITGVMLKLVQSNGQETRGQPWALTNPHLSDQVGLNPGFPKVVGRGEICEASFPFAEDSFFRRRVTAIGFVDSLGKEWWAPRGDLHRLTNLLRAEFPDAWTREALVFCF